MPKILPKLPGLPNPNPIKAVKNLVKNPAQALAPPGVSLISKATGLPNPAGLLDKTTKSTRSLISGA